MKQSTTKLKFQDARSHKQPRSESADPGKQTFRPGLGGIPVHTGVRAGYEYGGPSERGYTRPPSDWDNSYN